MNLESIFLLFSLYNGLPPELLKSICTVESNKDVNAHSDVDGKTPSTGICQVKQIAAKQVGFNYRIEELYKPLSNIMVASEYLKYQLKRYKGDVKKAVAAYNAGSVKRDSKGKLINQEYVDKVYKVWKKERARRTMKYEH